MYDFFGIAPVNSFRKNFFVEIDDNFNKALRELIETGKGDFARMTRRYNTFVSEDGTCYYTYDVAGLDENTLLESVKISSPNGRSIVVEFEAETEEPYGKFPVSERHILGLDARRRWKYNKKVKNGILVITFTPKEPVEAFLEEEASTDE